MTPWTWAPQASLSFTVFQSLLKFMSIESVMPSNHLILCHPLLLLPSVFPNIRIFSNESALRIRWAKYWSFSFSISPSNKYSGLISFRMDWFDLLAVQGTLKVFSNTTVQKHQFFALGSQGICVSVSASVLPMNTQDWSPLRWTGSISCSPRDSQESSPAPQY